MFPKVLSIYLAFTFSVLASESIFQPIHKLKGLMHKQGVLKTPGYVVKKYICPSCPRDAQCKPCMSNNIVISENNNIIDSYSFVGEKEIILFCKDSNQLSLGQNYIFVFKVTNRKTTHEKTNDLELISYHKN